ncbi:hypothetical protein HF673_00150 [Acidithiobacillus thiooxidans]|uniref:hypothetical protein n=1 Tax=Acidithiobacillus thiooxidans TaxID=930 RepID=UPI001C06A08F|nr:hypothetical protein [Acidithiobacillus thiooxidans]MBU2834228.1 hypothetical protein [Acidithiobacillus thiooxidans]
MEKMETIRMTLRGVRSKPRNPEAERRGRRLKRREYLSRREKLPDEDKAQIAVRGLSLTREPIIFSPESIRGRLLAAVLEDTVYDNHRQAWIFDGSIRDLALAGLSGGGNDLSYLLECMADFVRLGILTRLEKKRGRPVIYQVNAGEYP